MTRLEELEAMRHRMKTEKPQSCGIGGPNVGEWRRKEIAVLNLEILEAKVDLLLEKLAKVDF